MVSFLVIFAYRLRVWTMLYMMEYDVSATVNLEIIREGFIYEKLCGSPF